jgi:cell division protein FtsB
LERLLAEQRRKLEGQSERLGADALHAERLQKERLERELTKHAAELKAAKAELQATASSLSARVEEQKRAVAELKDGAVRPRCRRPPLQPRAARAPHQHHRHLHPALRAPARPPPRARALRRRRWTPRQRG